jgi:hypothetical protein
MLTTKYFEEKLITKNTKITTQNFPSAKRNGFYTITYFAIHDYRLPLWVQKLLNKRLRTAHGHMGKGKARRDGIIYYELENPITLLYNDQE